MKNFLNQKAGLQVRARIPQNVLRIPANVADAETVTIGGVVYEIDTAAAPGAITAGRIRVDCNAGVTPAIAGAALAAAINNNPPVPGFVAVWVVGITELIVFSPRGGPPLACTETLAGAANAWNAATMYGGPGATGLDVPGLLMASRAAIAIEVTAGVMHFAFPVNVSSVIVQARTAAGVMIAWNGAVTINNLTNPGPVNTGAPGIGSRVTVDNSGATDWAATDIVTVLAQGL